MSKPKTFPECLDAIARKYNKKDFNRVKQDFEIGSGVSKMMSEFEFAEQAALLFAREKVMEYVNLDWEIDSHTEEEIIKQLGL